MALGRLNGSNTYFNLGYQVKALFCKAVEAQILTVEGGNIIISWVNNESPEQPVEVAYRYTGTTAWIVIDTVTSDSIVFPQLINSAKIRLRVICDTDLYSFPVYVNFVKTITGKWIIDEDAVYCEEEDPIPDPFSFTAITNADLSTLYESSIEDITGINVAVEVSTTGGWEFRINSGSWITGPADVVNNDTVQIRRLSSPSYSTLVSATLQVGTVSGVFNITTKDNTIPDAFSFIPVTNADPSTVYISNDELITGITIPSPISISAGGEYQLNMAGAWFSTPGSIAPGDTVRVRQTSSPLYETETIVTLTIGGISGSYSVTTREESMFGNEFRSAEYRRNNCDSETETGTVVVTSVEPNTYFATTQLEANDLADAYIASVGQDNANTEGFCLMNATNSIALVDMYNDDTYDVCAYIDTPGVAESGVACYTGANFYLPTDPAATAFILASDPIDDFTNKRRFAFNIGKLIGMYPDAGAIPKFIFKIRGRCATAGVKNGAYSLKDPTRTLIMGGSPGTYMCAATPPGGPPLNFWSAYADAGANGSIGIGIGSVILTFEYDRAANTFLSV